MIKEKYLHKITEEINQFDSSKNTKWFIFGSSLNKDHFGDIDIGFIGDIDAKKIHKLKEEFEESTLPYDIDIINFNQVSDSFKNNVFNQKILWIKP